MQKAIDTSQKIAVGLTNIIFLEEDKCVFYRNKNGFLSLVYDGKEYNRVQVLRSLPLTHPDVYISVHDMENNEIGILENLESLPEPMAEMVLEDLNRRYYCPTLTEISSIKEKSGFYYFDVSIGKHKKSFSIKHLGKSIKELSDGDIMLTDVDGNRYLIADLSKLNSKVIRQLEPYLR